MQNFNFEKFEADLKKLTKKVFQYLTQEHNDICAFGSYSDESAMSISISYNTKEHLNKMLQEEPDEESYYRWSPGEWFCESYINDEFEELGKRLNPNNSEADSFSTESQFLEFREKIYNTAVKVLFDLKNEGLFNEFDDEFILLFSVSEFENAEKEIKWVKQLNSKNLSEKFENLISQNSE